MGAHVQDFSLDPQDYVFPADNYEGVLSAPLPFDTDRLATANKLSHAGEDSLDGAVSDPSEIWHPLVHESVARCVTRCGHPET